MTLEYLEIMEEKNNSQLTINNSCVPSVASGKPSAQLRRKCVRSFKSNTRVFDDDSIEVTPQEKGQPLQTDVKKVGKSKRYVTNGKNPLTCVELKCPDDVADKAAFFHKELAKLTKDIQIKEPTLPKGEYLINKDRLKVCITKGQTPCEVVAWLKFEAKGLLEIRRELYALTSEIDKCFVINENSVCPQK